MFMHFKRNHWTHFIMRWLCFKFNALRFAYQSAVLHLLHKCMYLISIFECNGLKYMPLGKVRRCILLYPCISDNYFHSFLNLYLLRYSFSFFFFKFSDVSLYSVPKNPISYRHCIYFVAQLKRVLIIAWEMLSTYTQCCYIEKHWDIYIRSKYKKIPE